MALVELVHPQYSHQVSVVPLINTCDLFKSNPCLTIAPYRVQSGVSLDDFQDFVSSLEDKPIDINDRNSPGLSHLSEEFGLQALLGKLSAHRRSPGLSDAQTAECRSRISGLEERAGKHERQLEELQSALFPALSRFEADLARLPSELEAFRDTRTATLPNRRQSHRLRAHLRSLHRPLPHSVHPPQCQQLPHRPAGWSH
jgi:hypothetical protein